MTSCRHLNLFKLPQEQKKLRCRHCHLTLKADELRGGYCPECFEADGKKRDDFEEAGGGQPAMVRYRCEDCGIVIECR